MTPKNALCVLVKLIQEQKKCPQCLSVQSKSSNLESNPLIIGFLTLLIAGVLGSVFYDNFYPRIMEDEAIRKLKISVSELSTSKEGETLYIACLGTIDNKLNFKFKDVKFDVSFVSNTGNLIDTFPVKDKNLIIMPNKTTNFRVRGIAQKKKELYNNCKVQIVDAWAI